MAIGDWRAVTVVNPGTALLHIGRRWLGWEARHDGLSTLRALLLGEINVKIGDALLGADHEIVGRLPFEPDSVGQVRLLNGAARMMDTFQRGLLVLQRLRTGGEQTIVVKNVTVGDGGQAIVGNVRTGEKKK